MTYKIITGIYIITNIVNGKVYVGSAKSIFSRMACHKYRLSKNKHTNKHLQSSYNKYGGHNFKFDVLELTDVDKKIIQEREEFYINIYGSNNKKFGYNKRINCETNAGIKASCESRKRMSISHMGINQSEDTKRKIAVSLYKEVYKIAPDGIIVCKYDSIISASLENNLPKQNISMCCRGKISHAGGYYWTFINLYDASYKFGKITRTYKQKKFIYKNTETNETYNKLSDVSRITGKSSPVLSRSFSGKIKNNTKFIRYEE